MILNNATNEAAEWSVATDGETIDGTKGAETWGYITPPAGPYLYTVTFKGPQGTATAENVNNPDACATYTGKEILITYPGA